jgi:hypothetical protein
MTDAATPSYVFFHSEARLEDMWREEESERPPAPGSLNHAAVLAIGDLVFEVRSATPLARLFRPSTLRMSAPAGASPTHRLVVRESRRRGPDGHYLEPGKNEGQVAVFQSHASDRDAGVSYAATFHGLMRLCRREHRAEAFVVCSSDGWRHHHTMDVLLWILAMETAMETETLFLHGAAFTDRKGRSASVAAAVSGGGKSTISQLMYWRGGRRILADECVAVFTCNGQWMVSGTPFGGAIRGPGAYPLKQFLILEKTPETRMTACPRPRALAFLSTAIRVSHRDSEAHFRRGMETLALALEQVPCYTFGFYPEEKAAEAV